MVHLPPPAWRGHPHLLALAGVCPESLAQCFTKLSLRAQELSLEGKVGGGRGGVLGGSEPGVGVESLMGAGPLKPTPRLELSCLLVFLCDQNRC